MIIVTGYIEQKTRACWGGMDSRELWRHWKQNCPALPVIAIGDQPPADRDGFKFTHIPAGNLGHVWDMPAAQRLSGFTAQLITGMLLCYQARQDMLYKEQDCFGVGNWLATLEKECPADGMLVGRVNSENSNGANGLRGTALMLFRHSFLLTVAAELLAMPESDKDVAIECKISRLLTRHRPRAREMSMGYDRTRPIEWTKPPFYFQQPTRDEIACLSR